MNKEIECYSKETVNNMESPIYKIAEVAIELRRLNMKSVENLTTLSKLVDQANDSKSQLLVEKILNNLVENFQSLNSILCKR